MIKSKIMCSLKIIFEYVILRVPSFQLADSSEIGTEIEWMLLCLTKHVFFMSVPDGTASTKAQITKST
jgi:hypothetical protein